MTIENNSAEKMIDPITYKELTKMFDSLVTSCVHQEDYHTILQLYEKILLIRKRVSDLHAKEIDLLMSVNREIEDNIKALAKHGYIASQFHPSTGMFSPVKTKDNAKSIVGFLERIANGENLFKTEVVYGISFTLKKTKAMKAHESAWMAGIVEMLTGYGLVGIDESNPMSILLRVSEYGKDIRIEATVKKGSANFDQLRRILPSCSIQKIHQSKEAK